MSFDPFGHLSGPQQPAPQPPPTDEAYPDEYDAVRERVQFPAMFLIATAVLNLLAGLFLVGVFVYVLVTPADTLYRMVIEQLESAGKNPEVPLAKWTQDTLEQTRKMEPAAFKRQSAIVEGVRALLVLVVGVLGLIGGVRMYQVKAYSSAMLGSLATAVPCLSPMTCCCGLGELVALWCVMILLLPSVREAFR